MIEEDGEPAGRPMAAVAFLLSRRVIRRLADTLNVVVAGGTAAEDRIVIHLDEREPFGGSMTVFAEVRAEHVIRRLRCRVGDAAPHYMTARTFGRRTLKHAPDMTALAIGGQVGAVETKPRRQMIEARVERRLRPNAAGHGEQCQADDCQQAPHLISLRSENEVVR